MHVDLSMAAISGSFFAPGGRYAKNKDKFEGDVYQKLMDNFAGEAKFFGLKLTEASSDGTKRIFFPKTEIHCECQLLAFLHCNPFVPFVHYIGLSRADPYMDATSICARTMKSSANMLAGLIRSRPTPWKCSSSLGCSGFCRPMG